jgi:Cdc6-like AAA superfamily ATPase
MQHKNSQTKYKFIDSVYEHLSLNKFYYIVSAITVILNFNSNFIVEQFLAMGIKFSKLIAENQMFWTCVLAIVILLSTIHILFKSLQGRSLTMQHKFLAINIIVTYFCFSYYHSENLLLSKFGFPFGIVTIFFPILFFRFRLIPSKKEIKKLEGEDFFNQNDLLKRKHLANLIANQIRTFDTIDSYAYGIVGDWGQGKTRFMNFITSELKPDANISIIEFNPWFNKSYNNIVEDFFINLKNEISNFHPQIENKVNDYISSLVKGVDGFWHPLKEALYSIVGYKEKTSQHYYNELNKLLKEIDRKVVVVIDDLDRLKAEEIFEVLRLIRNTANFHNTYFLIAYDKSYVTKSLSSLNISNYSNYLSKIIQQEIILPKITSEDLNIALQKYLTILFPKVNSSIYFPVFYVNTEHYSGQFDSNLLKDFRDVIKLGNALKLPNELLPNEFITTELLLVEMLKLKYPNVYLLIFNSNSSFLTEKENGVFKSGIFKLTKDNVNQDGTAFDSYLKSKKDEYDLDELDRLKINKIVNDIFSTTKNGAANNSDELKSIRRVTNYKKYLNYLVADNDIEIGRLELIVKECKSDELITFIQQCIANGIQKFLFDNYDKLFYVVNTNAQFTFYTENYLKLLIETEQFEEYEFAGLYALISQSKGIDSNLNNVAIKQLLEPFFEKKSSNLYLVEMQLLTAMYFWVDRHVQVYSKSELVEKQINIFEIFFKNYTPDFLEYNMYFLYHRVDKGIRKKFNEIIIKQLNEFPNYIDCFLVQITDISQKDPFRTSETPPEYIPKFRVSSIVAEIFGSNNEFELFLQNHKSTDLCMEYLAFYKAWKSKTAEFQEFIVFDDFSKVQIHRKTELMTDK